jgi:hypothetical protein
MLAHFSASLDKDYMPPLKERLAYHQQTKQTSVLGGVLLS